MKKDEILREIKRTAEANGGMPLGVNRFRTETGIAEADWRGKYWARWGDAIREAGLVANEFGSTPYTPEQLLEKYTQYAQELGRLPTKDDIRLKSRQDSAFPSDIAFSRRWKKRVLVEKLLEYCHTGEGYGDVMRLCEEYITREQELSEESEPQDEQDGFVYLIKSGRFYKIGKTNNTGRREYELSIQLPERTKRIHVIRTDDPAGIESYWHRRFEAKRKNGEWFALDAKDVAAFKRRRFM